jgi:hypothetical protein
MRTLVGLLIALAPALTPSLARADKTFNDGRGGTVDCKKDPQVTINANDGKYTFKGACTAITVNGNSNKLAIEAVEALAVNGNKNVVDVTSADAISTTGNENKVSYKKGSPKLSNLGTDNSISGGSGDKAADKKPADAPADKPAADGNATVVDCSKNPAYGITSGNGNYRFTGTCDKISLIGGHNKLTVENVKELGITGGHNVVDVVAADRIAATGSDNNVTYKKGLSGASPKIASLGKNNRIDQVK